jgi:carbohydrate-selective porin OprB
MILGYTNKDTVAYDVDDRYFLDEIIGTVPAVEKDNNHAIVMGGSQYISVNQSAHRSDGQTVGFGPFFRLGFAPSDRNAIDQFYSIGLGGNGGILNRHDDNWGIGVAYTSISDDLREDLDALNIDVDSHETVFEAFYNVAWTPAIRTSFNAQYVNSADPSLDSATMLVVRLQLDF